MEEVLDDDETACLAEFQRVLRGEEEIWDPTAMARIDSMFALIDVHRGRRVQKMEFEDGPLRVRVDGARLDIVLGQHTPEMRGEDRDLLVEPARYAPSPLASQFCVPATSRVFMLDLSRIPVDAFSEVHVSTDYGGTQAPFPHGNIMLLTRIGQVSTQPDTAVRVYADRCILARGFVSGLERTRYLTTLRLWDCLTLAQVAFPRMDYMHHLHLRLAHPLGGRVAEIDFSRFPVLRALDFAPDARVISLVPGYRDETPASGMLRYEPQGLGKYALAFDNLRTPHHMESVRLHLSFEDLQATALASVLAFHRLERLYLEVAPPAETHLHVDADGDVLMASISPTTCAQFVLSQVRVTPGDGTPNFLERFPLPFLRAQPLIRDGIPFDRTVPAFVELMSISNCAQVRLVALGRTASVLTGALPGHPDLFRDRPPRALSAMLAGAKHLAALSLTAGPLSDPRSTAVAPPDTFARYFACTRDPQWADVRMRGPGDPNRTFLGRIDVRRADMADDRRGWDAAFAPHGFFVLLAHKEHQVNMPSVCKERFDRTEAAFPVQSSYCDISGLWLLDFWPFNRFF